MKAHAVLPKKRSGVLFIFRRKSLVRRFYEESSEKLIISKSEEDFLGTFNALWAEEEFPFLKEYFDIIEQHYDGKVKNLNFKDQANTARMRINEYIKRSKPGEISLNCFPGGLWMLLPG